MVYRLEEGSAKMVELLGSKGAHASEMARIGIPVPPGFVITTEACRAYLKGGKQFPPGLWESIVDNVHKLEAETGKRFGDAGNPLVFSVRSGAAVSMPGMMDTILNMGVTDVTVDGLARLMADERPALDAYRRLIQGFSGVVLGVDREKFESLLRKAKADRGLQHDYQLPPAALRELIAAFKEVVKRETGHPIFDDPWALLRQAIEAVFSSWNNPRAITYREFQGIPHDMGTGCVIMSMVFGNLGEDSGTGVLFTRSPATGEKVLYGEFLPNAQGEDVVAGVRTPLAIASLKREMPEIYAQVEETARKLEAHYRDVQDIEFTVERGKLFILQTRTGKRTAPAAVKIAVDLVREGVLTVNEAVGRVQPSDVTQVLLPRFDPAAKANASDEGRIIAKGVGGSPGAASGVAAMDPDKAVELANAGKNVILVRAETSPDDVHGIIRAAGVLTSRGGMTSHAAVVTRGLGKPCVVGTEELHVDMEARKASARGKTVKEGEVISIDGATGEVFIGEVRTVEPTADDLGELNTLLGWADEQRRLQVWANADTPEDAVRARQNGSEGIGLCRTEHMFFAEDRLPHIQKLLSAGPEASRVIREVETLRLRAEKAPASERASLQQKTAAAERALAQSQSVKDYYAALERLEQFQAEDFHGILKAMESLPVIIRLLDAPLHEFLPNKLNFIREIDELQRQRASKQRDTALAEAQRQLKLVEALEESNPMLGHRGCRVGLTMPEIYEMQVRAIITAARQLHEEGVVVHPEIMIPIVSHVNELKWLRPRLDAVAAKALGGAGFTYKFGTMIEVPRAALTAGELAKEAQFFSFGSNDLTQMTFAYSRDDAEGKFLRHYVEAEVLPWNPFASIDTAGVGRLMRLATEEGRAANPGLEVGICGEHGGDPKTIAFCHQLGLNYVSCSPFRVPVARLAAAQSALGQLKPNGGA
ncbi:MAG: pyruvate, phosphate dikinase [SAR202 cluster bacterium]|nr:pyruvate, phosphate dikinase [SAR202 cluster bacterium]